MNEGNHSREMSKGDDSDDKQNGTPLSCKNIIVTETVVAQNIVFYLAG